MLQIAAIVGPTAVGKTKISIEVAAKLDTEIISVDSVQVYKYLNIGAAKIKPEEMWSSDNKYIKHHMIDVITPDETFSVVDYKVMAEEVIAKIEATNKLPLLVGGTGLYLQALIDPYIFDKNPTDYEYREELQRLAEEKGNLYLHDQLKKVDEVSAEKLHPNDLKRVIRALEVYKQTGYPIWKNHIENNQLNSKYAPIIIGLNMKRELLYQKINERVDLMIQEGLIDEVKMLLEKGYDPKSTALQSLGYKQIIEYLKNECSLDFAIENIKKETRKFAKRQLTWFKRDTRITWFEIDDNLGLNELVNEIYTKIGRISN